MATNGSVIQPINLDGIHFFDLLGAAAGSFGLLSVLAPGQDHVFVTGAGSQFVRKFAAGSAISAGPARNDAEIVRFASAATVLGEFQPGVPAFAGLAITGVGVGNKQTEYGWIRLSVSNNPVTGFPETLEAIDWAIQQTPGEAIIAGQQVQATPEPQTRPLALLASGALGVMALRRRRMEPAVAQAK